MMKFSKLFNLQNKRFYKILQFGKLSNILGIHIISKKWKNLFENKNIEELMFCYFNIRYFDIPKYRSFSIWSFQILIPTQSRQKNKIF